MNYILALIPTRFHDRAKAVIGLVGLVLTLALALPGAPVWLPILAATLTAYGIYQVPNQGQNIVVVTTGNGETTISDEGDEITPEEDLYYTDPT